MKLRLNERTGIIFWMFGLIVTPYILRNKYLPDLISGFNIISMIGVFIFARMYLRRSGLRKGIMSLAMIWFAYGLMAVNSDTVLSVFKTTLSIFLPLIIIHFNVLEKDVFREVFHLVLRFLDYAIIFMLICGVIDFVSGWSISSFLADYYGTVSLQGLVRQNRMVSYMGHSLLTTEWTLIYYIFHIVDAFYISKTKKIIVPTIIAAFVIALTGSKTGLVLMCVLILIYYGNIKMLRYIPVLCLLLFVGYRFGVFDLILGRFIYGVESGYLTTGRASAYSSLLGSGILRFQWLTGHSAELLNQSTSMIAALENPIMRWAYRYGILFALLMAISIFVVPFAKIVKCKNVRLILTVLVYIIDVNTYDTVCSIGDSMLRFCTVFFILFSAMAFIEAENNEDMYIDTMFVHFGRSTKGGYRNY